MADDDHFSSLGLIREGPKRWHKTDIIICHQNHVLPRDSTTEQKTDEDPNKSHLRHRLFLPEGAQQRADHQAQGIDVDGLAVSLILSMLNLIFSWQAVLAGACRTWRTWLTWLTWHDLLRSLHDVHVVLAGAATAGSTFAIFRLPVFCGRVTIFMVDSSPRWHPSRYATLWSISLVASCLSMEERTTRWSTE